jgi:hypothetical protein
MRFDLSRYRGNSVPFRLVRFALLLALATGVAACNYEGSASGGGGGSSGGSDDVVFIDPNSAGSDGVAAFGETVHPLLTTYCGECHASGPGSPAFATADLDQAYHATVDNQKANLANPPNSRLVRRLVGDFHHCWSDCASDGLEMQLAIAEWADLVLLSNEDAVSIEDGIRTGFLRMSDGVEDTGAERFRDNLIALWEFKQKYGNLAFDTSGVEPPLTLFLTGDVQFMSSYGIDFERGKAQAGALPSRKLYDRIAKPGSGSQQYSVEAWVTPANVTQGGPARIVSYSSDNNRRNFTLGQVLYNYDFRNRALAGSLDDNGTPSLSTYDGDQDLQDTLQHVVITYDQYRGRRIYVNAVFTDDVDGQGGGRLWNWDSNYFFTLGNEVNNSRPWKGQVRLVAVYAHALTDAQIQVNFNAGVGKRVLLRFDVSPFAGSGSQLEFTVSELDDYSYLFCQPTFLTSNPAGFRVAGLRIAVNGQVAVAGQAFPNVDTLITSPKQELSRQCSVISQDLGPESDAFSVEFDALGAYTSPPREDPVYPAPVPGEAQDLPTEGLRDFARINASLAQLTGVDAATAAVEDTWLELQQQLPGGFDLRAFSASNQVGIAKLALEYCDVMVGSPALRTAFFGAGFDFGAAAQTAFASPASRDAVLVPLMDRMLGVNLADQPSPAEVRPILDGLIDDLLAGCDVASCGSEYTETVVKASCAAVLSSAAVSVH